MKKNEYMEQLKAMAEADEIVEDTRSENSGISETENDIQTGADEEAEAEPVDIDIEGSREYSITISVKDMQGFVLRHTYKSISGWFGVIISLVALGMVCYGWNTYGNMEKTALIILALLFTVVQPIQLMFKARNQVKSQEMFKIPLIYNLCDEGIVVRQGEQKVSILWEDISKVVNTKKAVYIYTSPVSAFIFPKEQLGDVDEFLGLVKHERKKPSVILRRY